MPKKMRLILLIGFLVMIWGINGVMQSFHETMGPAYPGMIEYRAAGEQGQLMILGRVYNLSPEVVKAVEQASMWRDQLAGFLAKLEEIVKKYGRQAEEMMRNLREHNRELPL